MPKKGKIQSKQTIEKIKSIENELVNAIQNCLDDHKIENIINKKCPEGYFASTVIIGTGSSTRHVAGSAEKVVIMLKNEYDIIPHYDDASKEWVVILCGPIAVHLMTDNKRSHYNLEELIEKISK